MNHWLLLVLQVAVILMTAKACGFLLQKLGQPAVIGEMLAGICLGPSLLGWIFPQTEAFLFPTDSMGILSWLGQIGILLFMFEVGMDLDWAGFRQKTPPAIVICLASILLSFALGVGGAWYVYPEYVSAKISLSVFALFMGTAMSITAFPVLARIIKECRLTHSELGTTALLCAAMGDLVAWCVLAITIAFSQNDGLDKAGFTIALALIYSVLMLGLVKPWLERMVPAQLESAPQKLGLLVGSLIFVLLSAQVTTLIGIHALFGAFLAGLVTPRKGNLRGYIQVTFQKPVTAVLAPIFFAYTGLRTHINQLDGWADWVACGGLVAVATLGKFGGSAMAAKWTGMNWRSALGLGALMNTRGLMELIVLNIGFDLGIIPARIFTMMVLMAVATTLMTGPCLVLLGYTKRTRLSPPDRPDS
ncbi:MAG TPA: cation:proton antiporter [Opitutales bacterium]|jgi:Kef-type K+ transport system membrane component KefB|nr:cation:proton antiporter [Opitutales bacterium]